MKKNKALSALRHMTERAGLVKMTDFLSEVKHLESDPAFWQYVKEHLTKHEVQRFNTLKQINTDIGRGRAWLRACLNEHSLERYMHMLIEKDEIISHYYHEWAFMCDQERNSMLPTMAAGLGSILFAITVDRPELNKGYQNTIHVGSCEELSVSNIDDMEPQPAIAGDGSPIIVKKKENKKKKRIANVVSFDEDGSEELKPHRLGSTNSAGSNSTTGEDWNHESFHHHRNISVSHRGSRSSSLDDPVFLTNEAFKDSSTSNSETTGEDMLDGKHPPFQNQLSLGTTSITTSNMGDNLSKTSTGSVSSSDFENGGTLIPVGPHDGLMPISHMISVGDKNHSDSSSDVSFSHRDVDSAVLALAIAQKGLESAHTGPDISEHIVEQAHNFMSHDELKQAVVAMMVRKDEVEEQNRTLQLMLQQEMETSSTLRAEIAELKLGHLQSQEADQLRISKLQSENELLKHQLRKYVSAVQLLRTEGTKKEVDGLGIRVDELQPSIPPPKSHIDYSHEASEYEQKLIQVAEMHGELMEFNDMLHRQLNAKEALLKQLRLELITLRGPLPYKDRQLEDSAASNIDILGIQGRVLINIWIPSAFLHGTSSDQYHVYQVYVRIRDEEWNIFRRYSQFLDLHTRLKKVYPIINKFDFPPKKSVGNKDSRVVEARRLGFQKYLRNVINLLLEKTSELDSDVCKTKLVSLLPFFGDQPEPGGRKGKSKKQSPPLQLPLPSARQPSAADAALAPHATPQSASPRPQHQNL
ncbi:hypothetical protein C0Q70_00533 [Pomacea canaliculata]|uniref:PX domain-containing protein n=2 Tax=Pomacea canaliculata TaxID=400727 RepID=A0A2T7PWX1_POMCA|nr:hypothetical protein C0Q70_00533 [Pomacea canaliculata]